MRPKGYIEIFLAKENGEAASATLNFPFNKKFFSAYIGWNESKRSLNSNTYLDWYAMQWCYIKSFKYYDFGLTDNANKGLFIYKSSFNTTDVPYSYFFNPKNVQMANRLSLSRRVGAEIMKKIPASVNEKIGIFVYKYLL